MKMLERDICQLVCETSLAAVNHGLFEQSEIIRSAFPYLVSDPGHRRVLEATLLIGLKRPCAAMALLVGDYSDEANTLRRLTDNPPPSWKALSSMNIQISPSKKKSHYGN